MHRALGAGGGRASGESGDGRGPGTDQGGAPDARPGAPGGPRPRSQEQGRGKHVSLDRGAGSASPLSRAQSLPPSPSPRSTTSPPAKSRPARPEPPREEDSEALSDFARLCKALSMSAKDYPGTDEGLALIFGPDTLAPSSPPHSLPPRPAGKASGFGERISSAGRMPRAGLPPIRLPLTNEVTEMEAEAAEAAAGSGPPAPPSGFWRGGRRGQEGGAAEGASPECVRRLLQAQGRAGPRDARCGEAPGLLGPQGAAAAVEGRAVAGGQRRGRGRGRRRGGGAGGRGSACADGVAGVAEASSTGKDGRGR